MGEEIDESSPCSGAEETGPNAWRLARLMNPQICMKSIDLDVAAILVRFRLGLLQHMCRDTTLRWMKGAFFDSFGNLSLGHHRTGFFARRRWDLVFGPYSVKTGTELIGFDINFSMVVTQYLSTSSRSPYL